MTKNRPPSLYRAEALSAEKDDWLGKPHISTPVGARYWFLLSLFLLSSIILLTVFGSYTRTTYLTGKVINTTGLITMFSPIAGVVIESKIKDGQKVQKGDELFVISVDMTTGDGLSGERLIAEIKKELEDISAVKEMRTNAARQETHHTEQKIKNKLTELAHFIMLIKITGEQVEWLGKAASHQKILVSRGLAVDSSQFSRQVEYYNAAVNLASLEHGRAKLESEMADLKEQTHALPIQLQTELKNLDREEARVKQQLASARERSVIKIPSPVDGIITTMTNMLAGQPITPQAALASILPLGGQLEIELIASDSAIGFLSVGQSIRLRFDAYPYQRYGQFPGKIKSISAVPIPANRDAAIDHKSKPVYQLRVELPENGVYFRGQELAVRPGMAVDAYAFVETRPLYEWLLLPVFDKLTSPATTK